MMWGTAFFFFPSLYLWAELANGLNTSHSFYRKHLGFIRVRKIADCKGRGPRPPLERITGVLLDSCHLLSKPGRPVMATSLWKQVEESSSLVLEFGESEHKAFLTGFIFKDWENEQFLGWHQTTMVVFKETSMSGIKWPGFRTHDDSLKFVLSLPAP